MIQITMTQMMFIRKPALTMSTGLILAAEKTMAFGGVATGNMKAYEHVTVAGSIRNRGFTLTVRAISAKTGRRMLAVAVFEATSVTVAVIMQTMIMMAKGGRTLKPDNCCPSHVDSPDTLEASDMANPPPVGCYHQMNECKVTETLTDLKAKQCPTVDDPGRNSTEVTLGWVSPSLVLEPTKYF